MADDSGSILTVIGAVITALITAVGWLARRLYEAPKPGEVAAAWKAEESAWKRYEEVRNERDLLRGVVDAAYLEAKGLATEQAKVIKHLSEEIARLRQDIISTGAGGRPDAAPKRPRAGGAQ